MKKIFFISFIALSSALFAYSYPASFRALLEQFCKENRKVELITNQDYHNSFRGLSVPIHDGYIKLVTDDYITLDDGAGDITIITIANIVEIYTIKEN